LDIVGASAGIQTLQPWDQVTTEAWQNTIDTNLTGVWNAATAPMAE
jgi:NADP-dependent 3-hydroxy acid dehydrogenase YdfG